jgi:hypothetical protein
MTLSLRVQTRPRKMDRNPLHDLLRKEVKPSAPCNILHVKEPYKYEKKASWVKFTATSRQVSPASILGVSADNFQKALVDESELRWERTIDRMVT